MTDTTVAEIAAKGGAARAKRLTKTRRREIAQLAASARWPLPRATHAGELKLGNTVIPCAVLEDPFYYRLRQLAGYARLLESQYTLP